MGCCNSVIIRPGPNEPLDIRALVASIPKVQVSKRRWESILKHKSKVKEPTVGFIGMEPQVSYVYPNMPALLTILL